MTPLQIQMLLHYYTIAEPYALRQPEHASSLAVNSQRAMLVQMELLCQDNTQDSGYAVSEKGRVLVDMLCHTPMPVKKWCAP